MYVDTDLLPETKNMENRNIYTYVALFNTVCIQIYNLDLLASVFAISSVVKPAKTGTSSAK